MQECHTCARYRSPWSFYFLGNFYTFGARDWFDFWQPHSTGFPCSRYTSNSCQSKRKKYRLKPTLRWYIPSKLLNIQKGRRETFAFSTRLAALFRDATLWVRGNWHPLHMKCHASDDKNQNIRVAKARLLRLPSTTRHTVWQLGAAETQTSTLLLTHTPLRV